MVIKAGKKITDCIEGLNLLANKEFREKLGIVKIPYIFASINNSDNHIQGWDAISKVCDNLQLKNKNLITATKNRHRISTMFSLIDIPAQDREYVYKHLGDYYTNFEYIENDKVNNYDMSFCQNETGDYYPNFEYIENNKVNNYEESDRQNNFEINPNIQ